MTRREKIEAALSKDGTSEIPAVICYEGIYIRDHWDQLTDCPWWYQQSPDMDHQLAWRGDVIDRTGQDWFALPSFYSRGYRKYLSVEERLEGVFFVDKYTGRSDILTKPQVAGWSVSGGLHSVKPHRLAGTTEEIDLLLPIPTGDPRNAASDDDPDSHPA
jgi:hypothetical protein